ncbi:MAG TPA: Rne/Rng family ribonuclease, partial [Actinomycetaceae bacterium]|nr:Rne/Rng family ribonuclease [Actinomycetaceae bacterium]
EADSQSDRSADADDADEGNGTTRRRRRRRRGGADDDGSANSREGRAARDEITALKGSTRLEAKRQRRREGRDAGRRRTSITEAEFLARRESVKRDMVVREKDGRTQIAVLEDDVLVEHYIASPGETSIVGNVYLGRVQNVLPSMEAAFVDIGKGRNAVLYAGEVNWDAAGMEGQPRRIEQALSSGDSVLVQATKDPIGHKGARLTGQVTLAGRFLVLVPSGAMTGISRKLPEQERSRLKKLLKQIVPEGAGVIVRTAAEGATEEQLRADVDRLTKQWETIERKSKSAKSGPRLLRGEPELAVRVVRDVFNEDFDSLTVSGDNAWETISSYVTELSPDLAERMQHWTKGEDLFAEYRIDEQLAKALDRKVYLPSGGSLVIDRTEAMTVIDINTGKFTGSGGTLEETVTKNNLEAAEEIVRQLRLRDIGGIIVIDFIDMVLESNRDLVLRRLIECLGRDRTRHQVAEVTSLGLVQMTRKRVGEGLIEAFSEPCSHCAGRGYIVTDAPEAKRTGGGGGDNAPRRRRRGGEQRERAESSASAASPEIPDDAAREAVKATLATIAAAAANAGDKPEPEATPAQRKVSTPSAPSPDDDAEAAEAESAGNDRSEATTSDQIAAALADLQAQARTTDAPAQREEQDRATIDIVFDEPDERSAPAADEPPAADQVPAADEPRAEQAPPVKREAPAKEQETAKDDEQQDARETAGEQQPPRRRRPRRVTTGGPITT